MAVDPERIQARLELIEKLATNVAFYGEEMTAPDRVRLTHSLREEFGNLSTATLSRLWAFAMDDS